MNKFLIVNTDYDEFLNWLYAQHPGLENQPYEEQMWVRVESLFGVADFYSSNLRKLGHEAWDIHANNEFAQMAWAREHGIRIEVPTPAEQRAKTVLRRACRIAAKTPLRYLKPLFRPVLPSLDRQQAWLYDILAAQIKHYKPDVLLNEAMDGISTQFLWEMKQHVHLLIGLGEPAVMFKKWDWQIYDVVVAPSEGMVDYFRRMGVKAELLRFGFEAQVLSLLNPQETRTTQVAFVGSVGSTHSKRHKLLEVLCKKMGNDICIWAPSVDELPQASPVRARYQGVAWGLHFYRILSTSKIAINCHIDIAGEFADNMRLYEATGLGTLLVTDWKVNLHEMFEPGKEVVAYRTPEECAELVRYYLDHDEQRKAIASAGQERTLREHTYYHRMQELDEILMKHI